MKRRLTPCSSPASRAGPMRAASSAFAASRPHFQSVVGDPQRSCRSRTRCVRIDGSIACWTTVSFARVTTKTISRSDVTR